MPIFVVGRVVKLLIAIELVMSVESISNSCDTDSNKSPDCDSCYALVPYNPNNRLLSEFYERSKQFLFRGFKVEVFQEYDNIGVAGVVWEGVS